MTTGVGICHRCGNTAAHLFPGSTPESQICSRCYEGLRLHREGALLSALGIGAIVLGAATLITIAVLLLSH